MVARNLKGFIFTVDAIFALVVAVAGIAILLFSVYIPSYTSQQPASEATSILQTMIQTTVAQAGQNGASPLIKGGVAEFLSSQYYWPQYGNNASLQSSTQSYGPQPILAFEFQTLNAIYPAPTFFGSDVYLVTVGKKSFYYEIDSGTGGVQADNSQFAPLTTAPTHLASRYFLANSIGNVIATSAEGKNFYWTQVAPNTANVPLVIQSGYLDVGGSLFYPINGTSVASLGVNTIYSYDNGLWVTNLATSCTGTCMQGTLTAYALTGTGTAKSFVQTWSSNYAVGDLPSSSSGPTNAVLSPAAIGPGFIAANGGNTLVVTTPSGITIFSDSFPTETEGGPSVYNNNIYVATTNSVYGFTSTGTMLFRENIATNNYNTTPLTTPDALYVLSNGNVLQGFNPNTGALLWNTTLPSTPILPPQTIGDMAAGDGYLYVVAGNVLYAFDTCGFNPDRSILGAMGIQYTESKGYCGDALLNATYPSQNVAVFINGSYAPALSLATFNAVANSIIEIPSGGFAKSSSTCYYTMQLWAYDSGLGPYTQATLAAFGSYPATGSMEIAQQDDAIDFSYANMGYTQGGLPSFIGNWTMMTLVLNNTVLNFYLNGQLFNTVPSGGCMTGLGSATGSIGGLTGYTSFHYNGSIADVQIYNSILTPTQIQQLYQQGIAATPVNSSSIISWWPLEGDANDYSGYHFGTAKEIDYDTYQYLPASLKNAYIVSKASAPLQLGPSGSALQQYNVSIVTWR